MRRSVATCAAVALAFAIGAGPASGEEGRHTLTGEVDLSLVHVDSPFRTWLDEDVGKLRFDEHDDGLRFSRMFLDYRGRLTPTLLFHGVLNAHDDRDRVIDLTEAYFEWRPVPVSAWKVRSRVGAFYPKLSLENVDAGWSSPYALSSSAINTWIGEELRTVGGELRVSRNFPQLPFSPEIAIEGAIFYANDPAGALLNWRGWSIHDRQTGVTSSLPLPSIAAIEPWEPVPDHSRGLEPFEEIDHEAGYYAGAEWKSRGSFRLKYFHYDNHGDPEAMQGLDYAWQTRFDHLGMQFSLPGDVGVVAQWMDGITRMGPDLGPWHVWDSGFDSRFVLLTRAFGAHRLTVRVDDYDVQPYSDPDKYTNRDDGRAWAAAWLYEHSDAVRIGAEYLELATEHCEITACAWVFNGLPRTSRQRQFQLTFRWQFAKL